MQSRGRMSRARRNRFLFVTRALVLSLLGGLVTLAACSNQAEGDRCQAENGDTDCQSGLVCLAAGSTKPFNGGVGVVNKPYDDSDRCCPYDRSTARHPACVLQTTVIGEGGAPPPETGPAPDATSRPETSTVDAANADAADSADGD